MDVMQAILTRRSIRDYTGEVVTDAQLKEILRAGFYAPTARNKRPCHFVVVRNPGMHEKIARAHQYAKMLPKAGCCVVVCGDQTLEERPESLYVDCAAALENMLLAAHGLGLGAVWCGLGSMGNQMNELLHLPSHITPVGMMVVGNTASVRETDERYDESKIHQEGW